MAYSQPSTGTPLRPPGDQPHKADKPSLGAFSGTTMQETEYIETKSSPGTLFRMHAPIEMHYIQKDKLSLGTLPRVCQEADYIEKQTSLPPVPFSERIRRQITQKQTSLPPVPFSERIRRQITQKQTSLPLGPFSVCTRRQTTYKDKPSPRTIPECTVGRLNRNRQAFPKDPSRRPTLTYIEPGTFPRVHQQTNYL